MLEALGLTVMEEVPTRLDGGDDGAYLHDFGVLVDDAQLDCERDGERLAEAITAIWSGRCESDTLNALVVRAGLRVDDVVILRAYRRYRRIVAPTFTAAYQNDVLCAHPKTARAARRAVPRALLRARRRGARGGAARATGRAARGRRQPRRGPHPARLRGADRRHRAHERGARAPATSRSSCARPTCRRCRAPAPLFEIFVYHPQVEGIHLRGGHVARGGIRWSDRREDYRTEVLGLMKAQMVKNAVIVPGRRQGRLRAARTAGRSRRAARRGAAALLDAHPRHARRDRQHRRRRGRAPRGRARPRRATIRTSWSRPTRAPPRSRTPPTRSRSSTASGSATRSPRAAPRATTTRQLGITARGAWESVKRHFRELGRDVDSRPFTVAGIGDMSGDVFGNGMLLSRQIQLVAAFDHRHVFLDPVARRRGVVRRARAPVRAGRRHVLDGLRPRR